MTTAAGTGSATRSSAPGAAGSRSRPYLPVVIGFVAASVILFIWFWPVLTAAPLTDAEFKLRVWFTSWA